MQRAVARLSTSATTRRRRRCLASEPWLLRLALHHPAQARSTCTTSSGCADELGREYHPFATKIPNSNLRADYRKEFNGLHVQAEVQFGNMARWYSDVFKFQAACSEKLIQ